MSYPRLLNRPVRLYWAGWETDTYRLGEHGWLISAEQDVYSRRMRIAIKHPEADVQGMTEIEEFHFRELMEGRINPALPTMLRFATISDLVYVNHIGNSDTFNFHAIDHRPMMCESKIERLEDFANFAEIAVPKHEVYLHEANINQILEMAIQRQEPEQDRIRKEMQRNKELQGLRSGQLHTELRLVA